VNEGTLRADSTATLPAGAITVTADNAVAVGPGSLMSATGSGSQAGTGRVSINPSFAGLY
jgi:hypothetical protein